MPHVVACSGGTSTRGDHGWVDIFDTLQTWLNARYQEKSEIFQGGSGQFGIVTKFYQKAFQTPSAVKVGFHVIADRAVAQSFRNTESFFRQHSDPFSLMYYALAYLPAGWPHAKLGERKFRTIRLIVTLW